MNVVKEIERITVLELENGIIGGVTNGSWHDKYKKSAWVYLGGLSYELTEGDVICVMSQWGEIEDIHLVRDKSTNKSQGFAFVKYEDQRSTILAVDNFNGIKLLGRVLRCDHVDQYKLPKEVRKDIEDALDSDMAADVSVGPGHAYKSKVLENEYDISKGIDLWAPVGASDSSRGKHNSLAAAPSSSQSKWSDREDKTTHKKHKHNRNKKHKRDKSEERDEWSRNSDKSMGEDEMARHREEVRPPVAPPAPARSAMSALPSTGAIGAVSLSWRGVRDPTVQAAVESLRRRTEANIPAPEPRAEFSGFGGMSRLR